jgi:hypothetical protein
MKVWLDDVRVMPEGFDVHCLDAKSCIERLSRGDITFISFDHDLGDEQGQTGYDVAKWVESAVYRGEIKMPGWRVHSGNPVGAKNIVAAMRSAARFASEPDDIRGDDPTKGE